MNAAVPVHTQELSPSVRRFADVFPAVKETCMKYTAASKWYNLEKLEPDLVKLWIQQLSIWTRSAFKVRGHVYANCPHPELRMAMLEVVGEEDVIDPRVGMNHRQLLATSLGKASGQSIGDLEKVKPLATTLVTFDILYGIANRSWEEGIALASGLERFLQESGYFLYEAKRLQRDLGWSDQEVAWFSGHAEADEEHGQVIELLDKYITDDRKWDAVSEAIIESVIAWWILFDGVLDAYRQGIRPVEGVTCKGFSSVF
jgi:pyrroloquinoline quinone (PQQ) biosynthesis protein C